ncbi:hypothetical protein IWQ60_004628 [Tieghemiomyces parasiticus]|uniref:Uncharacterized protein n=1 Tax=Tieghemiomyces parasiticus TaxID=78921 RepID=A0A9W8A811_9FUNG|nr:hypothetical protein IWQ60_004628 [Tieghemiomyces parasiticus]
MTTAYKSYGLDDDSDDTDGAAFEFDRYPATASAHYGGNVTLSDTYAVPMASLPRYTPDSYSKGTWSRYSDEDKDGCDDGGLGLDYHQTPQDSTANFADRLVQYLENQIPCSPSAQVEPPPYRHYHPTASLAYSACE